MGFYNKLETLFENRPNILKVVKSLGLLLSERVLRVIVGFFVTAWVVNHLGPESYGKLVYVIQYVLIFVPFVTFGMGEIISRDIVQDKYSEGEILGTSTFLKSVNSFVGVLIISATVLVNDISLKEKQLIIMLSSLLFGHVFYNIAYWYEAKMNYRRLVFARNVGYLTSITLKVLFILGGLSFEYFMYAYAVEMFLSIVLSFGMYVKMHGVSHWKVNKSLLGKYYKESLPLFFVSGLIVIEQKVGILMIKEFEDPISLGQYSLAFTVFTTLIFIPQAIVTTLFPTLVKSKDRSEDFYFTRMKKLYCVLIWASIGLAAGTYLIGGHVLNLIFGQKYIIAVELIKVMTIYCIFVFFDAARRKILVLEEKGLDYLRYMGLNTALVIAFQYYFIKDFSVYGAVYGSIAAVITSNTILAIFNSNIGFTVKYFFLGLFYPLTRLRKSKENRTGTF